MNSLLPPSEYNLIDPMTQSDVIMASYCWIYRQNPNFPQTLIVNYLNSKVFDKINKLANT